MAILNINNEEFILYDFSYHFVIAYICDQLSSEILMVKITAHLVYLKKIN